MAISPRSDHRIADGRFTAVGARASQRLVAVGLVAAMAVGSVVMWLGVPIACLYVASQLHQSQQPHFGVYVGVLVAIIVLMSLMGKLLGTLGRLHARIVDDAVAQARRPRPWLRSMRGERDSGHRISVLDVIMLVSVSVAVVAMAIWFFFFAGSSLPL